MEDSSFTPRPTEDGSYTFFSEEFQETFHSSFGAKQEAEVRYVEPCLIKQLAAQQSTIRLLDICYGLGYNSAAALEAIWSINPKCRVELMALEISADVPRQAIKYDLLSQWQPAIRQRLTQLFNKSLIEDDLLEARLLWGDARKTIAALAVKNWQADAIFLDPFSPPKCPQLWTVEFISLVVKCLHQQGRLATYSCSAAVRTAFLSANLDIASITGAGRKSPGTLAVHKYKKLPALSQQEQEHLKTRAAIPYRDPNLKDNAETIIARRQQEQQSSNFEPTSQWKKRWL
ncbi:tRNA (5-methylaminomethyl-2-thiouridine)(34)-methyltransferase MnmD [Pleurocapsa sp. FMAR1]|uniref:tRNA (5-methylaminomethyl-2-thiouridine)(34)-methyltransferase MnmD n=1 Tax=Pleurocapsa sp. FMAR1 TaxID=3040204 RepID=UPI0029C75924|nr:MnmC family methyltransferase [Pleurocapsa sp. FMAR1]